jgi:hypothetical protein
MLTSAITDQVLRDMRQLGVRFGFVSTYKETVFLKIVLSDDGKPGVLYSRPIPHTSVVVRTPGSQALSSISVRLGILFLLHRAANSKRVTWAFEPGSINASTWITSKPNRRLGPTTENHESPFKNEHTLHTDRQDNGPDDGQPSIPLNMRALSSALADTSDGSDETVS